MTPVVVSSVPPLTPGEAPSLRVQDGDQVGPSSMVSMGFRSRTNEYADNRSDCLPLDGKDGDLQVPGQEGRQSSWVLKGLEAHSAVPPLRL